MLALKCAVVALTLSWWCISVIHGKSIDRCEFVHELKRFRPQIDYDELNTWTCIAQYQSNFNTSLRNSDGETSYHGIFQISDLYWCANNLRETRACKLHCDKLHDSNLKDDFECLQKIYAEHLRIHGSGYSAWPIYDLHCRQPKDFIKDCLSDSKKSHIEQQFGKGSLAKLKSVAEFKRAHKIYERCELARELYYVHDLPFEQIAKWVCIARYESNYNTSAIGRLNADGSGDHGLFQISDIYWCSPPGKGWVCGLSCAKLENADISDDVQCMLKIYAEHQRLSGDGFNAWSVYQPHCKNNADQFVSGCFENDGTTDNPLPMRMPGIFAPVSPPKNGLTTNFGKSAKFSKGKSYTRCELAQELRYKHNIPKEEIHTWICIAQSLSKLNTGYESPKNSEGTASHGLFQISDKYWCSLNGKGNGCELDCSDLRDDDITDDIQCAHRIFDEHKRFSGNGYLAWTVYENHCKYETAESVRECFENEIGSKFDVSIVQTKIKPATSPVKGTGKIYERCELAKELRYKHNVPLNQISSFVCIAQYSSNFITSKKGINEHGIFQISDRYWCSLFGSGMSCGISCSYLEDSNIADDVKCAQKIHSEHERLFGDGFQAWAVYEPYCKEQVHFTADCFDDNASFNAIQKSQKYSIADVTPQNGIISSQAKGKGKIYNRCELANELLVKYKLPREQIHTWVCIAKHESNFDTSAVGRLNADGSGDHGLFQISDIYWCSISGVEKACGVKCSKFEDSDISDDIECIKKIYDEHQRLFGNGKNSKLKANTNSLNNYF